jgi:hypothetical protein
VISPISADPSVKMTLPIEKLKPIRKIWTGPGGANGRQAIETPPHIARRRRQVHANTSRRMDHRGSRNMLSTRRNVATSVPGSIRNRSPGSNTGNTAFSPRLKPWRWMGGRRVGCQPRGQKTMWPGAVLSRKAVSLHCGSLSLRVPHRPPRRRPGAGHPRLVMCEQRKTWMAGPKPRFLVRLGAQRRGNLHRSA